MCAVLLGGICQPRSCLAEVGNGLSRRLGLQGLEYSLVQRGYQFVDCHRDPYLSSGRGRDYFDTAAIVDDGRRPFGASYDLTVERHGDTARLNLTTLHECQNCLGKKVVVGAVDPNHVRP